MLSKVEMFELMLKIRIVEEEIAIEYKNQEMRTPVHLCIGQEATPVGVSAFLENKDLVVSGHRSHGHYIAKGGNIEKMIAEIYGKVTGCSKGKGGSQHLVDTSVGFMGSAPILASTIAIGTGLAFGLKMRKSKNVVVSYFGDSAVEEGIFYESLNFASLHKLPIIYVCENNLYSTHSKLDVRQPNRAISKLGESHLIPSFTIDGNNVREVSIYAEEAISRARKGMGPTFLECLTYRWLEHVGPNSDVDLGYRTQSEIDNWIKRDPLTLERKNLVVETNNWEKQESIIKNKINLEVKSAFDFAKSSDFPDLSNLDIGIYPEKVISFE